MRMKDRTIGRHLAAAQVSRRELLAFCGKLMVAAPFGLALTDFLTAEAVAQEVAAARRLPVIWLHFQDCTGCTESLLRASKPDLAELILHLVSLDYHETLMAAAGHQAEKSLRDAMRESAGGYVLVVEGSIPTKEQGAYMKLAGRPALDVLREAAAGAAAVIAIGSCASWGGIPSSPPDPTGAVGVDSVVRDRPVVNLPGCPPNPYTLLGVVLQYASNGTLPELDAERRPKFAYDRTIHEHCPRRGHFDAGRFAREFGDEGHRRGWCLYMLGCKGPVTHAGCSTRHFNEIPDVWPIGIGAPCVGCTERAVAFRVPMFEKAQNIHPTPPDTYPPIEAPLGRIDPVATGLAGLAVGAAAGATYMAAKRFSRRQGDEDVPEGSAIAPPADDVEESGGGS